MGYCKHHWEDRSEVLRTVFAADPQRREHDFYVCSRCLRIDEVPHGDRQSATSLAPRITAA